MYNQQMELSTNGTAEVQQRNKRPVLTEIQFASFNKPAPKIKHSRKKGRKVGRSKKSASSKTANLKTLPTTGTNTTPIKVASKYLAQRSDLLSARSSSSQTMSVCTRRKDPSLSRVEWPLAEGASENTRQIGLTLRKPCLTNHLSRSCLCSSLYSE